MFVRTNSDGKDTADRRATKQKICLQQSSFFCVCQSAVALFRFFPLSGFSSGRLTKMAQTNSQEQTALTAQ